MTRDNPVSSDASRCSSVAGVYRGWRGITQPCDVCSRPVAVNAVSPSECLCSVECSYKHYEIDAWENDL